MSIIWLSSLLVLATLARGYAANTVELEDFEPAENCGACHTEIYQQWQTSYHSRAATDSLFWKIFERAAQDLTSTVAVGCLSCHAPIAIATREIRIGEPLEFPTKLSPLAQEGVTCDYCHTVSGREYIGKNISSGIYRYPHQRETETKYGSHANAKTPAHDTRVSRFLQDPEFCGICHKFSHPVSGEVWQNTYAEWKKSPYARQGTRCQDCHMPSYGGQSADGGPEREDLHAHAFPGGFSEMVQKAATIALWAQRQGPLGSRTLKVSALVANRGSGHLMPTGIPGIRQMWVEIVVRNAQGKELSRKKTPLQLELLDGQGNPTMPWQAVAMGLDTRIAPGKSRKEVLEISLTGKESEILEVDGAVYYRRLSEQAAQHAGMEPSPAVVMCADRIRVLPDGKIEKVGPK